MTKIAILQVANSRMDESLFLCLNQMGVEWMIWQESQDITELASCSGYILPPGDESVEWNFQLAETHRAMIAFLHQAAKQHKPILGMGLGACILIESGLVPGIEQNNQLRPSMTLTRGAYDCDADKHSELYAVVELTANYQRNVFTQHFHSQTQLMLPLATKCGRFVMAPTLAHEIHHQGLNLFKVVASHQANSASSEDYSGKVISDNPFGTPTEVACVNKFGNVLATTLDFSKNVEAAKIFYAMRDACDISFYRYDAQIPLYYFPRAKGLHQYKLPEEDKSYFLETPIQKKKAVCLQQLLQSCDIQAQVHCLTYIAFREKKNGANSKITEFSQYRIRATKQDPKKSYFEFVNLQTEMYSYARASQAWQLPVNQKMDIGEYWAIATTQGLSYADLQQMMIDHHLINPFLETLFKVN